MAAVDSRHNNEQRRHQLPPVLLHRLPQFNFSFTNALYTHFTIIDTLDSPLSPQTLRSVRALVSVGPTPVTSSTLDKLPSLRLVVLTSAGVDHVDLSECRTRGIVVTNASDAFSDDVADYAVGLLVDVLRRVSSGDRFVRNGLWTVEREYNPLGFKVGGRRVGIVGMGNVGYKVAKRLVSFGCSIAYNSRRKKDYMPFPYYENVLELAVNSDVLIICCALNEETRHLINRDVLMALGKEGVVINVGRGALIDEKELVECLVQHEVGGAGLDVFEDEPNVPRELFELDFVVLSPHCAVVTPESFEALQELILHNLKAFFENKPLLSVVRHE